MKAPHSFVLIYAACVSSEVFFPQATNAEVPYNVDLLAVLPTQAPNAELVRRRVWESSNLRKRDGTGIVAYLGRDNTCGYINGDVGEYITCGADYTCGAVVNGAAGCCSDGCFLPTTCYNSAEYWVSSACDHACQNDVNVRVCSMSTAPFCYTYTFPDMSATLLACDVVSDQSTYDTLSTTYDGENDGQPYTGYNEAQLSSLATPSTTGTPSESPTIAPNTRSTTTSSTITTTQTPAPPSPPSSSKHTPIGAIVGGAVGGVAVIALAVTAGVYLCMRSRKAKGNEPSVAGPDMPPQGGNFNPQVAQTSPYPSQLVSPIQGPHDQYMNSAQQPQGRESYYSTPGSPVPPYSGADAKFAPLETTVELPTHNSDGKQIFEAEG